jgi:hypothetical protein
LLAGLPPAARTTATASVAGAHAVAHRLGSGGSLISAADHAYLHGMIEVALVSAIVLAACAPLVLLFLPERARSAELTAGEGTAAALRPAGPPPR